MPTTLTGEVERITFENDETSFRVIRVGSIMGPGLPQSVAVVGTFQAVGPGTRVRVTGEFVKDPRHGPQFRADALIPIEPDTLASLEKYLGSGAVAGIGPGFAKRIVAKFGMDTLKVLDSEPVRLAEVPGLGAARAELVASAWAGRRAIADVMLLLQTHGATPGLAARIVKHYGDRAAQIVQRSPYRLALDVYGIGFKTADNLARSIGISGDHPERAQAGVVHVLGTLAEQGHVLALRGELLEKTAEMLSIDQAHVDAAIDALWASGHVVVDDDRVYLARLHAAETQVVECLSTLLARPERALDSGDAVFAEIERRLGLELAPAQRRAVELAASRKLCVVTGGPGVGKTTIVRAILALFRKGGLRVRMAAPTGRAAKRLSEATRSEAVTIHRLLEFDPRQRKFLCNESSPLDADALVVDEASMIDMPLAAALLAALPKTARLVIVGDADQLPSVGPGAFLRDLIASGRAPTARLDAVFRQAQESRIVQNAHHILHGRMPEGTSVDEPNADFFVIARRDPEQAAALITELVTERIPRRFGLDPIKDVQVLSPMHRGPAGTSALNAALQQALNPVGPALELFGQKYRTGDKVMQTKNDYDRDIFNGDIGSIVHVDERQKALRVRFDERVAEYRDREIEALVLAYATTIHKSQGSEYPAVVIPLLTTHFLMLSRNLVYTAVTRAKRLCVLVADPRALGIAVAETHREERMTRLTERLRLS